MVTKDSRTRSGRARVLVSYVCMVLATGFLASLFYDKFLGRSTPAALGDTATVPENMLIVVKNPDPIEVRHREFSFGDQCMVLVGDTVTAVAFHEDRVLVRTGKPGEWFYGVCIPGIVFFMPRKTFADADRLFEEVQRNAAVERALVRTLLKNAVIPQEGEG